MLEKALAQLSTEERALVFLFYKEEKTIEEISSISELTKSNVKTKLFRIRKKLFVLLKEMEG
jgi:RNA polymerase sigma-70 factor (ECF subfamily)